MTAICVYLCIEVYLELHITIAQNGCGNQSCAMSHTKIHHSRPCDQFLHPHTPILHAIKKRSRIHKKIAPCERALKLKKWVCRLEKKFGKSFYYFELRLKARPVSWNKNSIENNLKKSKEGFKEKCQRKCSLLMWVVFIRITQHFKLCILVLMFSTKGATTVLLVDYSKRAQTCHLLSKRPGCYHSKSQRDTCERQDL